MLLFCNNSNPCFFLPYLSLSFFVSLSLSPSLSLSYSKQGSGTDFLFHGYQQVVILPLLCCTLTAHHSFL